MIRATVQTREMILQVGNDQVIYIWDGPTLFTEIWPLRLGKAICRVRIPGFDIPDFGLKDLELAHAIDT